MSLLGALKIIPWSDVVAAAPAVVRGAQQLWGKVRHEAEPAPPPPTAATPAAGALPAADALAALAARVQALESRLAEQSREAAAASGLIAQLAEQNARLIDAVEQLRRKARRLVAAATVLGVGTAVALAAALLGR